LQHDAVADSELPTATQIRYLGSSITDTLVARNELNHSFFLQLIFTQMVAYTEEASISEHTDDNLPVNLVLDTSFGAPHWFAVEIAETGTLWFYQYPGCLIGMDNINGNGLSTHWKPQKGKEPAYLRSAPISQLNTPYPAESWFDEEVKEKFHIAILFRIPKNEYKSGSFQQGKWLGPYGHNIKDLLHRPFRAKEGNKRTKTEQDCRH